MDPSTLSARRILVIDDDRIMRELLMLMLGTEGHEVTSADSGDEALAMLPERANDFDIVLTDMHMPGTHGVALAQHLRAILDKSCLLIGMSGSQPVPDEVAAFDAFLEKPFTMEQLNAAAQPVQPDGPEALSSPSPPKPVLDDAIFTRLAAMMPATQLGELYRITLQDIQRRLSLMRSAHARGDEALCRAEAHSIKGGCGMVGAAELSALAAALEEEQGEFPASVFDDFDAACERLRSMLETRIK
jgi:CheY-like chemotaxis protein